MNVFFEIADAAVVKYDHKYLALYEVRNHVRIGGFEAEAVRHSDRVWLEEENGVRLIKHRSMNPIHSVVDMKEFFWIKLRCKTL